VQEVERRARAHPAAPALLRVLATVADLAAGADPGDPFAAEAAARYALYAGAAPAWAPERLRLMIGAAVFALAGGAGDYRALWIGHPSSALVGPGFRGTSRWDRFAIPAWAGRVVWRGAHLAAATLPAWRVARAARRLAGGGG
jgi:hypothetical protein